MRISDWSSDVCSSDLIGLHRLRAQRRQRRMVVAVGADGDALFLHLANLVPGEIAAQMLVDRTGGDEEGERQAGLFHARPAFGEAGRSEEHTSELQSLMRISYDVFCLKKKTQTKNIYRISTT